MGTRLLRPAMPLYTFAHTLLRGLSVVFRMRVYHSERVPLDGPLIVAANHVSYFDPPMLGAALPRPVSYMAKQELFAIPLLGRAIAAVGAYPVDRHGSAGAAIKRSVEVLRAGGAVGIFPEGTRNREGSGVAQLGVALLASLTHAPVLPVALIGTAQMSRLHQIKVVIGEPLALPSERKATREELAKFTDRVMESIRALAQTV